MTEIKWSNKFLIGVPRIDHEHRVFADLIASISEEEDSPENRERVLGLMREFELYAQFHFCSEENIMRQAGYPQLESHSQEHLQLLGRLKTGIRRYQTGNEVLEDLVTFLFEWFSFHTTGVDLQFANYLKSEHPQLIRPLAFDATPHA